MNIFVYSDESGVFDKEHNKYFVFGGLIFLGKNNKDEYTRRYSHAEKAIRQSGKYSKDYELKASNISNKEKNKLYRSLNQCYKFGVVINQDNVLDRIFKSKKDKQRFLDYTYKIAVKKAFQNLINNKVIDPNNIENIYFFTDEHTTATNGKYELQEGLEQEFKHGTYNMTFSRYFEPIFPQMNSVEVQFCNSNKNFLVRAADIVSNHIFHQAHDNSITTHMPNNLYITKLP